MKIKLWKQRGAAAYPSSWSREVNRQQSAMTTTTLLSDEHKIDLPSSYHRFINSQFIVHFKPTVDIGSPQSVSFSRFGYLSLCRCNPWSTGARWRTTCWRRYLLPRKKLTIAWRCHLLLSLPMCLGKHLLLSVHQNRRSMPLNLHH